MQNELNPYRAVQACRQSMRQGQPAHHAAREAAAAHGILDRERILRLAIEAETACVAAGAPCEIGPLSHDQHAGDTQASPGTDERASEAAA